MVAMSGPMHVSVVPTRSSLGSKRSLGMRGGRVVKAKVAPVSRSRAGVVDVTSDYVLKGKGQIKVATGETVLIGRDRDDSDVVVNSPNGM